jgi:hypothetical protein
MDGRTCRLDHDDGSTRRRVLSRRRRQVEETHAFSAGGCGLWRWPRHGSRLPVFQHTWPMETIDLCCEASASKAGGRVPRERTHGRPGARGRPPPTPRPAAPVRAPDRYLQRPHARTCSAVLLGSRFDSAGARRFYQANNTVKYSEPLTEGWLSSPGKQCKDDIHSTLVFSLSSTIVNAEWLLLPVLEK